MKKKDSIHIQKKSFIKTSYDNILHFFDFHPKILGQGAYGIVYKAKQKNIQGPWRAIKKISKKSIKQPQNLLNQIQILKSLDHPSIVRLYQCYQDQKNLFLVTDLCDGGQLFDRLQKSGNFTQRQAHHLFRQMIQGINYCHHQNIAHRDLKPQNFLFLNKNSMNLKIIDFGLSYKWKQSMRKQISQKKQKKLIGTSYYLAPQIIDGSYDERCDIWSLGVILYILVTAIPPFDGQDDKQIIANVKKLKYTFDIPEMQSISHQCKDLIKKMLLPVDQRITLEQVFNHSWMMKDLPNKKLKLSFSKIMNFSKFSKLKKLAATYIASKMSQQQVEQLGRVFQQIDLNHDGQISIQQLKQALSDQKNKASLIQLKDLMSSIDTDKNGKINYTEFLAFGMDKDKIFKQSNIKSAFRMLDKDGNGYVDRIQLQAILKQNGMNDINGKSLEEIIDSCDKDRNGQLPWSNEQRNITVQSIKTCITKTKKRLEDTIIKLQGQNQKYNLITINNIDDINKKFLKQLQENKQKIIIEIQTYFKEKQTEVKKETAKYNKIYSDLDLLKKQLQQAIKQLKIFKKNLFQTTKTVEVIQKANKIDYNLMIQHFNKKSKRIIKYTKINIKLQENKQKKQQLRVALKDLIQLKTNQQNSKIKRRQQFKDSLQLEYYQSRSKYNKKQYITNPPPLSADRYFNKSSFLIEKQNYFKSGEPFLHFLQVSKANLHIVKIRQLQQNLPLKWEIIPLNINFSIPSFHKTIATQQGVIYLIGGTQQQTMKKSAAIYQYTPKNQSLTNVCRLNYPRSSHSIVCNKGLIYIIGGIGDTDAVKQCQVFNSYLSICQPLPSCKHPTINSCVSYLQSANSLVKVGGIFPTGQNNDHVQIYNISSNHWLEIDPIIDNLKGEFQLLSCSGWGSLNDNQIFIYGGYNEQKDNQSSGLSYVVQYNTQLKEYGIKHINIKNLPCEQGFWSQQSIVHNNVIYGLQNIDGQQGGDCLQDQRNVVIFDGKYWKMF